MAQSEVHDMPNFAWIHWKQAMIHKHRIKFWMLFVIINIIYPIVLMSFCWNIIDCANILEWKIYLIINPFIIILWFIFYAQLLNMCCGPSPLRRYSKCSFISQSIFSNWILTIGIWTLFACYILIKMIYFAIVKPDLCNNTYQSFHLFPGFLFILIYNISLTIMISKEQYIHFCSIYKSNSLSLPWNATNNYNHDDINHDNNDQDNNNNHIEYHEPELLDPVPIEMENNDINNDNDNSNNQQSDLYGLNDRKYNFFGSATFETYFKGVSTVLNRNLSEEKECTICMDEIVRNQQTVFLICDHKFHEECIVEWLKRDQKCPLCRTNCHKDDAPLSNV